MSAIPGNLSTDTQPPMTVPLQHFLVALGFLVAGVLAGLGLLAGGAAASTIISHVHLLLAGWVCVTIMGAMTQFIPVWSGVELHSRRLATAQLFLVTVGLAIFAAAFTQGAFWLVAGGALTMLTGFWIFVYNIARTLARVDEYDVTERHFWYVLGFFLLFTSLGLLLAVHYARPVFGDLPVTHSGVRNAHITVAVFGAVLTTIYGAIYQLGTMFTQTSLGSTDRLIQRIEEGTQPIGVVLLASGWLLEVALLRQIGGTLVIVAALGVAAVIGHKLLVMTIDRTPMHTRYAVVVVSLAAWALLAIPAWVLEPATAATVFGAAGTTYLLAVGAIGFVVIGTLYHIIPFIIWVHEYSDLLGLEPVPMVDELYDHRLAALDWWLLVAGTLLLLANHGFDVPTVVGWAGGLTITGGVLVFVTNMLLVISRHGSTSIGAVLSPTDALLRG